ncbi:hypothetical protein Pmani_038336 [Petrolisthes manimaculis]|uniref:Uncharacterized protein n=1 Tax=Petrolisthes manimaculis TaxID=1843537 RepID=A0AAE1NFY7_9EUCA|nr:hypothetical protein Pmani_038336 [Petrolisthes manimaculis]
MALRGGRAGRHSEGVGQGGTQRWRGRVTLREDGAGWHSDVAVQGDTQKWIIESHALWVGEIVGLDDETL